MSPSVFFLALSFLSFLTHVHAWGAIGHQITAAIAEKFLTPNTQAAVSAILAVNKEGDLVNVSTWADQVRSLPEWKWSEPLHFINTPDWACKYAPSVDCADSMCVAGAIVNYTSQITSTDTTTADVGLKFITHFSGDIHQPLHVSFSSDLGGNDITGTFFGTKFNLHAVWDEGIIQHRISKDFNGDRQQYINYLLNIAAGNQTQWSSCFNQFNGNTSPIANCVQIWADESAALACSNAYVDVDGSHIVSGFSLGDSYYQRNFPIVDQQLAKGGIRMAANYVSLYH